jgi:PAS domain S-box-containing protein
MRRKMGLKSEAGRPVAPLPEALVKAYEDLFDQLPDIHFFVKDPQGRFLTVNRAFAEKCGFASPDAIIGLTDLDVWPKYLGEKYRRDDAQILKTGQPAVNTLELVYNGAKSTNWYSTTKIPIRNADGTVSGIAGFTRDLKRVDDGSRQFVEMGEVFDYIMANYREPIDIRKLSALACLSVSQFERKFKSLFKMTPRHYISMVRVHGACRALINTGDQISTIAEEYGFYDLSHLNRSFKRCLGMTPSLYRKQYSNRESAPLPDSGLMAGNPGTVPPPSRNPGAPRTDR